MVETRMKDCEAIRNKRSGVESKKKSKMKLCYNAKYVI